MELADLVHRLPKAELHLHIEGALEPELMLRFAKRNAVGIRYGTVSELRAAYAFGGLQDFLDLYYDGVRVLRGEEDFFELTSAYLERAARQNVRHAEIFFDPQAHTQRDVSFETCIRGIHGALEQARTKLGISTGLILCFLRHLSADAAMETLEQALDFRPWIMAVGLDSSEVAHPPGKFEVVFRKAREAGFLAVAHAGEEGPPEYIWDALDRLGVCRIDHGVRCLEDPALVERLAREQVPLTLCPLSNLKLGIVERLEDHPYRTLLERNLMVTINSDDPAYFGGYLEDNYLQIVNALGLTREDIIRSARNSFIASFLAPAEKAAHLAEIDRMSRSGDREPSAPNDC